MHLVPRPTALRTSRWAENLRPHVITHKRDNAPIPRLERFGDGGYPLFYLVTRGGAKDAHEAFCPSCATELHEHAEDVHGFDRVTHAEVNWENPEFYCDECSERIPSAYAEEYPTGEDNKHSEGYSDCHCCGETIIDRHVCDGCVKSECKRDEGCSQPKCEHCETVATLNNDGNWHSNCEPGCPNAGSRWKA